MRWLPKEQFACDTFAQPAKATAVPRRDFWDVLGSCIRVLDRTKASALRIFDAFLALVIR